MLNQSTFLFYTYGSRGCKTNQYHCFMKNKKFIKVAASLGLALPVSLMGYANETTKSLLPEKEIGFVNEFKQSEQNQVKSRIFDIFKEAKKSEGIQELAHTDVHANYTIPHTNIHANYYVGNHNNHTDSHSNSRSMHVNDHSNAKI